MNYIEGDGLQNVKMLCVTSRWLVSKTELENATCADVLVVVDCVCENEEQSLNYKYACLFWDGVLLSSLFKYLGPSILFKTYKNWISAC